MESDSGRVRLSATPLMALNVVKVADCSRTLAVCQLDVFRIKLLVTFVRFEPIQRS